MKQEEKEILKKYKKQIREAITDLKTKGRRHRQIPNILTLMRLLSPCFILPTAISGNVPLMIGMTALFSLTDMADGFIARNWELTSELGKDLDAVTDKVFASTLLLAASFSNPILLCNLGLEGIIAGINIHQKVKGNTPSSSFTGKIKTFSLFALVAAAIASPYLNPHLINTLTISTTAMQGLTLGSYIKKYHKNSCEKSELTKEHNLSELKYPEIIEPEGQENEKNKTYDEPTTNTTTNEQTPSLEKLKEMSTFLHQEQENKNSSQIQKEEKGFQKIKKERRF